MVKKGGVPSRQMRNSLENGREGKWKMEKEGKGNGNGQGQRNGTGNGTPSLPPDCLKPSAGFCFIYFASCLCPEGPSFFNHNHIYIYMAVIKKGGGVIRGSPVSLWKC